MNDTSLLTGSPGARPESAEEHPSEPSDFRLRTYFSAAQWVVFGVCLVGGLLLRWIGLDERPYHHDESLHGMYGRYFYDFPDQNFYKYSPMLHGPGLYNLLRVVYSTVGYSDWGARSIIALLGSLVLFLPLIYRRFLSRELVLAITAFAAFSPTLIYWSRFLREDFIVLTGWALLLHGCLGAAPSRRALFVLLGLAVQFCTKENSFVTAALLVGYLLFEGSFRIFLMGAGGGRAWSPLHNLKVHQWECAILLALGILIAALVPSLGEFMKTLAEGAQKNDQLAGMVALFFAAIAILVLVYAAFLARGDTALRRVVGTITHHPLPFLLGFFIAAFLYCYLYSAGFRYDRGILDGLYRESIGYWAHHHNIERIAGPFLFHFYVLSWYEMPFVIAFFLHLALFYRRAPRWIQGIAGLSVFALILALTNADSALVNGIEKFFKLKDLLDLTGLVIFLIHPVLVTIYHLAREERALAFWGYFFTANLFTYSYLGEKVPWLTLYPFIPGIIYLALFFHDYFTRHPISNWASLSLDWTVLYAGSFLIVLGLAFAFQEGFQRSDSLASFLLNLPDTVRDSWFFLLMGVLIAIVGTVSFQREWLPRYNLKLLLFFAVTAWSLRIALLTNFVYAGHARELLSQVHTTPEFHRLMKEIRNQIEVQQRGYKPTVYISGDATWPSTWYLRDIPEYKFSVDPKDRPSFSYIVQDWAEPPKDVPFGFKAVRVNLRGWWVPDMKAMTLRNFLNYALNHTPWNSPGYQYVNLLVKQPGAQ